MGANIECATFILGQPQWILASNFTHLCGTGTGTGSDWLHSCCRSYGVFTVCCHTAQCCKRVNARCSACRATYLLLLLLLRRLLLLLRLLLWVRHIEGHVRVLNAWVLLLPQGIACIAGAMIEIIWASYNSWMRWWWWWYGWWVIVWLGRVIQIVWLIVGRWRWLRRCGTKETDPRIVTVHRRRQTRAAGSTMGTKRALPAIAMLPNYVVGLRRCQQLLRLLLLLTSGNLLALARWCRKRAAAVCRPYWHPPVDASVPQLSKWRRLRSSSMRFRYSGGSASAYVCVCWKTTTICRN